MAALVGTLEGTAEISLSAMLRIWVVEATGLLSSMTSEFGKGSERSERSGNKSDTAEVLCTETGSSLSIELIAVEMVTAVGNVDSVSGRWEFRSPFSCAILMGGVVEWSIAMLTSVIKEGRAEGSTKDKGAPPISEVVEWSVVVPILALVVKEGIAEESKNEGAALVGGVAGWSTKGKVTFSRGAIVLASNHSESISQ